MGELALLLPPELEELDEPDEADLPRAASATAKAKASG